MSEQGHETPVAPGDPNAGAAIVLRMIQGAHPEDAETVRDWLQTLPARLHEAEKGRDQLKVLASKLMAEREEKVAKLESLIAANRAKAEDLDRQGKEFVSRTLEMQQKLRDSLAQFAESLTPAE